MNVLGRAIRSMLWRTGIGRKTARLFWKLTESGPGIRYLQRDERDIFDGIPLAFADERYNRFLEADLRSWRVREAYVLELDDVLVEPERCLAIRNRNELIAQTIFFRREEPYPFLLPYLLKGSTGEHLDEALLYDGTATRNYFHHLVDVLSMLAMFRRSGLNQDMPVIVNTFVYNQPFFQHLLGRSAAFRALNWRVLQPGEWIRVKKLYRTKAFEFDPETWAHTRALYGIEDRVPTRRVFLSRDKSRYTRGLSNEEEVIELLGRYGFETVYAEHLSVDEQQALFQDTKYLVALTGMGLIQQFFMNAAEAHVLEIIPLNRLMPEYYCQAFSMGIHYYDVLLGEPLTPPLPDGSYERLEGLKEYPVDTAKLEAAVQRMLENRHPGRTYGLAQL